MSDEIAGMASSMSENLGALQGPRGDCSRLVRLLSSAMAKDDCVEESRRVAPRGSAPSTPLGRSSGAGAGIDTSRSPKGANMLAPLSPPASAARPLGEDAEGRLSGRTSSQFRGSGGFGPSLQRMNSFARAADAGLDGESTARSTGSHSGFSAGVRLAPLPVTGLPEEPCALPGRRPGSKNGVAARSVAEKAGRVRPSSLSGATQEPGPEAAGDGARRRTPSQTRLAFLRRNDSEHSIKGAHTIGFGDDFLKSEPAPVRSCLQMFKRSSSGAFAIGDESIWGHHAGNGSDLSTSATPIDPWDGGEQRNSEPCDFGINDTSSTADEDKCESTLLCRRRLQPLAVSTLKAAGAKGSGGGRPCNLKDIKDIVPMDREEKIFDLYQWDEVLQETGDGGKVVVCKPKSNPASPTRSSSPIVPTSTQRTYVMKMRSKESLSNDCMADQFRKSLLRILNLPPHIGVLPIHEVLEDDKFYYIVMERASGAFFNTLLTEFGDGVMPAASVKKLTREILEALGHIHQSGMLHRDVKPDNLVFQAHDDPKSPTGKVNKVSLIDFDHAEPDWTPSSGSSKSHWCGTVRFSAPETFNGIFSQASDLYSVGVILYMLLAGKMPYDDCMFEELVDMRTPTPNRSRYNWRYAVFQRMRETPIDWHCDPWPSQPVCTDFCQKLLAFEASYRPGCADEALQHQWFAEKD